jgi:subtilase family serine protease
MTKTRLFAFAVILSFALGTWGAVASLAAPQETAAPQEPAPKAPVVHTGIPSPVTPAEGEIATQEGTVIVPESSVERPEDAGVRMHTNYVIFAGPGGEESPLTLNPDLFTCQVTAPFCETPASMACVYKVGPVYAGCNPATGGTNHATGGGGAIALVDAYDNPNAASDLAKFSSFFGLPAANFVKVYANTSFGTLKSKNGTAYNASCSGTPPGNMGWGEEEDLDIEWAHAMAPGAKIILVEACSNSNENLFFAELVAQKEVAANGYGDISNSWGGGEFAGEVTTDFVFLTSPLYINYFASAGDSGWGAAYPSSSPYVISAGGTTVNRNADGNFLSESCWGGSGGGNSSVEKWQSPPVFGNGMGPWADFQYPIAGEGVRRTPDLSFNANPASGVIIYDSYLPSPGFYQIGGTSVASPSLAGIVNASQNYLGLAPYTGGFYTTQENNLLYSQVFALTAYPNNFYLITTGSNGGPAGTQPGPKVKYNECTGIGSPRGHLGK